MFEDAKKMIAKMNAAVKHKVEESRSSRESVCSDSSLANVPHDYEVFTDELLSAFKIAIFNQAEFIARKRGLDVLNRRLIGAAFIELMGTSERLQHADIEMQTLVDMSREP